MIVAVAILLGAQLAGEALVRGLGLPFPGPVVGMLMVVVLLAARQNQRARLPDGPPDDDLASLCRGLLKHLSLLFVPAGVGVIQRLDLLGRHALDLTVALTVSTALGIAAAALAFRAVARLTGDGEEA